MWPIRQGFEELRSLRRRFLRWRALALNAILAPVGRASPRSPKQWLFGTSTGRFVGNPRFLFLWIRLHRPDIRIAWISDDAATRGMLAACGFKAYRRWSPRGVASALRSAVFAFSHGVANVNPQLSRGAFLLNLWHGVGLKSVHFGYAGGRAAAAKREAKTAFDRLRLYEYLARADVLATTSPMMQRHFSDQFDLPADACPRLGYPRLDVAGDLALRAISERIDRAAGFHFGAEDFAETYLYMPTYRDTRRPFLDVALPDPAKLSVALSRRNALLYVKPHPASRSQLTLDFPNLRRWPDAIEAQTYLPRLTGLITDYSSVLYDYLAIRDTGAILYTFDLAEYLAQDRTLLYPFEENVAGLRVTTFDSLCDALERGDALTPIPPAELAAIRRKFWAGSPSPSSAAIVAHVETTLKRRKGELPR